MGTKGIAGSDRSPAAESQGSVGLAGDLLRCCSGARAPQRPSSSPRRGCAAACASACRHRGNQGLLRWLPNPAPGSSSSQETWHFASSCPASRLPADLWHRVISLLFFFFFSVFSVQETIGNAAGLRNANILKHLLPRPNYLSSFFIFLPCNLCTDCCYPFSDLNRKCLGVSVSDRNYFLELKIDLITAVFYPKESLLKLFI